MSKPRIRLEDMTEPAFEAYLARMIPTYAADGARATGMTLEAGLAFAEKQIATLLSDGRATPGHHFKTVLDAAGTEAGVLWFLTRLDADPPRLFVYDLHLDEDRRGQGLGTACLDWLVEEGTRLGAREISLSVFADNVGAIRLYERLGFVCTRSGEGGMEMARPLS